MRRFKFSAFATLLLAASSALAQSPLRPPSVPLVACDPYFSIWSPYNEATGGDTTHWTNRLGNPREFRPHRLTSTITVDGKPYRILGGGSVEAMKQTALTVTPLSTAYTFQGAGVEVELKFTTPLLLDDLMVASRPVTYVTWTAKSTDGGSHEVSVAFTAGSELAVNKPDQAVVSKTESIPALAVASVGSVDQPVLGKRGDDLRIDWGYLYLAAPDSGAMITPGPAQATAARDAKPLSLEIKLGSVGASAVSKYAILAYDDIVSIKYYRTRLKPYWRKDGADAAKLLQAAAADYESLMKRCAAFDKELVEDMRKVGGESYVQLGVLAYRQALAAQKICADENGQPLSFSKENYSNGCIATVDVIYPAAPQMLVFSPSLLKASLVPLLDYSSSDRWKFDSAPHDLGTYPHVTGQVYGGENTSPMPVEESGNMLILLGALAKIEGNADLAAKYWPTLTLWKDYLVREGLDPANQLCTDDFAGHFARNANLSAKAIMGIASWGLMAEMLGHKEEGAKAIATAREYARKWMELGDQGDHYGLVFGAEGKGTWSQKYNLVWDRLLDLKIFPPEVIQKEVAYYRTKMNKYGLPLDSRKEYTKLDWEVWTATMAGNPDDFRMIVDACAKWVNETPSRVPMSDWYETVNARAHGFQARSVVGGVFIGLMQDKAIWTKYASRDTLKPSNWAKAPTELPQLKTIVAAADKAPTEWKYTTARPAQNWYAENFNDSSWKTGKSGFGTSGTPGAIVNTNWDTREIWVRREFNLDDTSFSNPALWLYHDEDVEVYLNGTPILKTQGFVAQYDIFELPPEARKLLRKGKNTLAIHCRQTTGGQYIDAGFVDVLPTK